MHNKGQIEIVELGDALLVDARRMNHHAIHRRARGQFLVAGKFIFIWHQ